MHKDQARAMDIVINATSTGIDGKFSWEDDVPVHEETIFYDLSYSKGQTSFFSGRPNFQTMGLMEKVCWCSKLL